MKPTHIFGAELIEPDAFKQFNLAMEQPYTVAGALMPDAHFGYTLPIGAVVAVRDHVYPSYVGFDQGCGMGAVKTRILVSDLDDRARVSVFNNISRNVPNGVGNRQVTAQENSLDNIPRSDFADDLFQRKGINEINSLGGGNHFLEIGYDEDSYLWFIVHSGSRGFGHGVSTFYMEQAGALAGNFSRRGKGQTEGHHPFHVDSQLGKDYIKDLNFCLAFALENRQKMLEEVLAILVGEVTRKKGPPVRPSKQEVAELVEADWFINRNHNHAELKDGLWIHRKGATHAELGMLGVIPGSMGTGCFIVKGKGNPDSLCSSSHGAGRQHSRRSAKENLTMEGFKASMVGICATVKPATLDESPAAYKDIFAVMEMQKDLVDVLHHIKPIINVKGEDNRRE